MGNVDAIQIREYLWGTKTPTVTKGYILETASGKAMILLLLVLSLSTLLFRLSLRSFYVSKSSWGNYSEAHSESD
jgi:hypothetical protein